jgi:phosphoribosylamine--glycine ligase
VPIGVGEVDKLLEFARSEKIELTVVGPEYPLTLGIVDRFREVGLTIFGPTQAAALLEGSKSFAKGVMVAAGVPTASYALLGSEAEGRRWLKENGAPVVLKSDGLAAGKGVFVCHTTAEADAALTTLFGEMKASSVVAEEMLTGPEASFIVATDGNRFYSMAPAHDYKRIGDNDTGANTGGMGAVCPTPHLTAEQARWAEERVIAPMLQEMRARGTPFTGFLYAGLMLDPVKGIKVLEFNARFGDPECQGVMRRFEGDLARLLQELSRPGAGAATIDAGWRAESSVTLVIAAEGYPGEPRTGDVIEGIEFAEMLPEVVVFHAGTDRRADGKVVTKGGRVLAVTALGASVDEARERAYKAADMIQFRGRQLRRDIARTHR